MIPFIKVESGLVQSTKLTCSHPRVNKIWATGALAPVPTNSTMVINLHLFIDNGRVVSFDNHSSLEDAQKEAEEFLLTLK